MQTLATEFKVHHYAIIELLDDETALENEQGILDDLDDEVAQLSDRVERLMAACSSGNSSLHNIATKRLKQLDNGIAAIFDAISAPRG
ncbi:MAG: hypothetical protein A6F71_09885 [Cycloclasticus sp. symbiont of Poecilosclerida sp. M]|nr:MAG: hypothetical protein A6F71_09885 [Cycloclasticus sp. symbiont of Poecilosclerida sp. M]